MLFRSNVAETFANTGAWPADNTAAGGDNATLPSGKYVTSETVKLGTIQILYGLQANSNLKALELDLRPTISTNNDVIWTCGKHAIIGNDPAGGAATADATTVLPKYLPQNCRA